MPAKHSIFSMQEARLNPKTREQEFSEELTCLLEDVKEGRERVLPTGASSSQAGQGPFSLPMSPDLGPLGYFFQEGHSLG